jgi:hypothetical protein
MRKGLLGAVLTTLVAAGIGAAPAPACDSADITPGASARPGDSVPWTAAGLQSGASYVVSVSGVGQIASGISDGSPVRGTFTMPPRVGSAAGVSVELEITHDDFGADDPHASRSRSVAYEDTSAAQAQPQPQPPTGQEHAASPQAAAPPAPDPGHAGSPNTPASPPNGEPAHVQAPPHHHSATVSHTLVAPRHHVGRPLAGRASTAAERDLVGAVAVTAPTPVPAAAAHGSRVVRAETRATELRSPAPVSVTVPAAAAAQRQSEPVAALIAVALIALGGSLLGLLVRRRRPGDESLAPFLPDPVGPSLHDALVEAELQELLAEEEARTNAADARGAPVATGATDT